MALILLALLAGLWLGGGPAGIVGLLTTIGEAHLASHNALAGSTLSGGRREYLLVLTAEDATPAARAYLGSRDEPRFERDADFAATLVVSMPAGDSEALDALRAADFTRLLLSDRWIAFCH